MNNTFKEKTFTLEGRIFRRTEAYNPEGKLFAVYFERFVPETSVYRGLGKYSDRHACWRLVPCSHHKLRNKLQAASADP